jgi:hypothetical protein
MTDEDELQGRLEDYKEPIEEDEDLGTVLSGPGRTAFSIDLLSEDYWLQAAKRAEDAGELEEAEMLYSQARQKWQT